MRAPITALVLLISAPALGASDCNDAHVPIARVQGPGTESPMAGRQVIVQGILTADLRQPGGFRGFYVQQALSEQDRNDDTSEGLFVHTSASGGEPGDRVLVRGVVREYYGLTSLTDVSQVDLCGSPGLPVAQPLATGVNTPASRESLEGMLVQTGTPLTIIDTWNLALYGELVLASSPQHIPTQLQEPGPGTTRLYQQQERQRLILDDGHRRKYPHPIPHVSDENGPPGTPLRIGDKVAPLVAVFDYRFGDWRLQPISRPRVIHRNPRQEPPDRHPDSNLRVVSLNLGNLFNGNGQGGNFPTSRGASSHDDYQRQLARLAHQIRATDPDILTVSELENDGNGDDSAATDLVQAIGPHWNFVKVDSHQSGGSIRNGILYRDDRVVLQGPANRLSSNAFEQWHRPALSQAFKRIDGGASLTVISVHLKSKSCRNAPPGQQAGGDGQGCFVAARTAAARQLGQMQAPGAGGLVLLAGDFNAYAMETPIKVLSEAGFTDLVAHFHGLKQQTFRYHGRLGTLDYHLANRPLKALVLDSQIWSVNVEEPRLWAYDAEKTPVVPANFLWRASDHNPVITDLRL